MAQSHKKGRSASLRALVLAAVTGLVLGLLGGLGIAKVSQTTYISSTTYSVAPADSSGRTSAKTQSDQLAQLAFLTPIASGRTSDAEVKEAIEDKIGHTTDAQIVPSLIPDSQLLFQVQVRSEDKEDAYAVAQALQEVLPQDATTSSVMKSSDARLVVVSTATEPESSTSVPKSLIIGGSGVAGALVATALVMAYAKSRRRKQSGGSALEEQEEAVHHGQR